MARAKASVEANPCAAVLSRTAAGEIKVGIIEEGLGVQPARMVWLSGAEIVARFGVEGGRALIARAREAQEDT